MCIVDHDVTDVIGGVEILDPDSDVGVAPACIFKDFDGTRFVGA